MFETIGRDYGAYHLEDKKQLEELNAQGYLLRHNKTGARIVAVSNDDNNKVFNIGFRTPPKDDTGVPHILEHSVLCGSKEFPAKDPFIELVKGSLNTFLNAMTYSDKTLYPVASCNDTDFRNLMHVYLDAVFYPNIYQRPEILKQEGWHYDLESVDADITYNGVVYNEMKGVFSSPEEQLFRNIQKSLLPGTPYEHESGGDPKYITDLTFEEFLDFHKKYYHPSNSYIYLYGDMNMEQELEFIDSNYLSHFETVEVDSGIGMCAPFEKIKDIEECYSIAETESLEGNTFFSYNAVIGTSLDSKLSLAFQILDYVLMSSPGAPLKKALIDAGIGSEVFSSYDNGILQPTYSIVVKKADAKAKNEFLNLIQQELLSYVKEGIDKNSLKAAINYFEFKYKEANFGRYPKGLMYGLQMFSSWLYADSKPFIHVQTNRLFDFLKEQIESDYFEQLIQEYLLDNTHKTIITMNPKKGLNAAREEEVAEKLKAYKESLSDNELEALVSDTNALKSYQEMPSPKEDVEKIPLLSISDIDKKILPLSNKEYTIENIKAVWHDIFTNGIAYLELAFRLDHLDFSDLSWASLLTFVYQQVDTKNYSYKELSNETNIQTGGIGTNVIVMNKENNGSQNMFQVKSKVLFDHTDKAFELIKEIILTSDLGDMKRLKEIIAELKSGIQVKLSSQGHSVAANRASSYFSTSAYCKEQIGGIGFYEFLTELNEHFEDKQEEIVLKLRETAKKIFCPENLIISYTGDQEIKSLLEAPVKTLIKDLYEAPSSKETAQAALAPLNEGFKTASQVQYVATAGNYAQKGFSYTGALKVLQVMFSYDYLWTNVRVKGGAYGCMCGFSRFGDSYFTSYRDPNLMETVSVYKQAHEYVKNFDCDDRDMTKYIIGAISNLDTPLEPSAKGARSFSAYLMGITEEDLQRERDEVLAANQETIRGLADLIQSVTDNDIICAIGDEKKLEQEKENFKVLYSIF